MAARYGTPVDRKSAYEMLKARAEAAATEAAAAEEAAEEATPQLREFNAARRYSGTRVTWSSSRAPKQRQPDTLSEALTTAVIKELSGTTGARDLPPRAS